MSRNRFVYLLIGALIVFTVITMLCFAAVAVKSEPIDNFAVLTASWKAGARATNPDADDLVAIWQTLADADKDFEKEVAKAGIWTKAQEGLLVRRRAAQRLAPVLRGALQSRGMSLCDYFLLERNVEACLRASGSQTNFDSTMTFFFERCEFNRSEKEYFCKEYLRELSAKPHDCTSEQISILVQFLANDYNRISDFEDALAVRSFKATVRRQKRN